MSARQATYTLMQHLGARGISLSFDEANTLRRAELTLQRWAEGECGSSGMYNSWAIERDEKTEIPYMVIHPHKGKTHKYRIADREKGALKRLAAVMSNYPALSTYVQGDPRGASLYVIRPGDVPDGGAVDSYYSRGLAVYK